MSLEQSRTDLAERRAASTTEFWCQNVCELVGSIRQLHFLRNKQLKDMDPAVLAQRKVLLEAVIKMLKNELKVAVREMVTAQELWENME